MGIKRFELYTEKNNTVEEAYDFLKANVDMENNKKQFKSLAILSCSTSEGKTSTAVNLAIKYAENGRSVLLVDADLRKPNNIKHLNSNNQIGLTSILLEASKLGDIISETNIENLKYISSGKRLKTPTALLSSSLFENFMETATSEFDIVIFDTPPLASVVDAVLVAAKTEASLLIVKAGEVPAPTIKRFKVQLENAKVNVLGVVLNRVNEAQYRKCYEAYDYFYDEVKLKKIKIREKRK